MTVQLLVSLLSNRSGLVLALEEPLIMGKKKHVPVAFFEPKRPTSQYHEPQRSIPDSAPAVSPHWLRQAVCASHLNGRLPDNITHELSTVDNLNSTCFFSAYICPFTDCFHFVSVSYI